MASSWYLSEQLFHMDNLKDYSFIKLAHKLLSTTFYTDIL